ncbi:MAG: bifunctional 5,10-methylenetetrahydrofolate dehydrogenase/5,10-methenyltetrahydrofolate cyclohydrolase [Bacillota bacterium]|nr:bifunctional 5,10-methylenetetrahydrofolate dehydrogenase/5,10-methenyltetrahydrofolate cyclohydrolase [Bacillota bacterium]
MAKLLKGIDCANRISEELMPEIQALKASGVNPCLAILRIGENPDDLAYERGIEKRFAKLDLSIKKFVLDAGASQDAVLQAIDEINGDDSLQGALLFRPFPKEMDDELIRNALRPEKDLDGISDGSLAGIFTNSKQGFAPCTPEACVALLKHYGYEIAGKNITVLGRSLVIGKPVSMMLLNEHASVTICHSKTKEIREHCKRADIVIGAIGKAEFIDGSFVGRDQVFLDVGINVDAEGKLLGDIKLDEVEAAAEAISPVPGGVGSITTSILASHLVEACKRNIKS